MSLPEIAVSAVGEQLPAPASRRRWADFLRLYPFEIAALASMALTIVFLRAWGLRTDWQTVRYIVLPALRMLPRALLAGIGLHLLVRLLARYPVRGYLLEVVRPRWWVSWLRMWFAAAVMTYGYFWLKVAIPLVNPRLWDGALWDLDARLHLGVSPSVFVSSLLEGTPLVPLLDRWYWLWVPTVFYALCFWSSGLDRRLAHRFLLSCVLLWTLGSWIYVAVPALGPVFVQPQTFEAVREEMPLVRAGQQELSENYELMLAGRRTGELKRFKPVLGIAAMPSLHVGAHFLFFLWARRRARWLALAFALATAFTFAGSLLSGYHYAIDGYAGMLLAWLCFRAAVWIEHGEPEDDPVFPWVEEAK